MPETLVVFSCDQHFFPLAKGLVLSLQACALESRDIGLAFLDAGCSPVAVEWLRAHGVDVRPLNPAMLGTVAQTVHGYLRCLVYRPLLPRIFPNADAFIWMDSDMWVQLPNAPGYLSMLARSQRDKLFICPEWHYSYVTLNEHLFDNQFDNFAFYYRATYGEQVAAEMAVRPMFNCGLFAMAAENPLWNAWWEELVTLYSRDYGPDSDKVLHMAEQIALNVLVTRRKCVVPVDPLFNYMCMWGMPFRDNQSLVRVALPPASVIGVVHLPLWKMRRQVYFENRLLYQGGAYLTEDEKRALLA